MKIINPLQMNDWDMKNFLIIVATIQVSILGIIGLDAINLQIPIIRSLIGFIYLTFMPGIIVLRILKLHKLGNIETILFTVGLSITTLMFTGFFINMVYPFFGISGPMSTISMLVTMSVVILLLSILCYIRDKDFSNPSFIDSKDLLSSTSLFLISIPFLAVFGTYFVNFKHTNIVILLLIVIISATIILIGFGILNRNENLYPLAIFTIALSFIYHNSLISMNLWGWDIHFEYYLSNLVIVNSLWDSTIPSNVNAMLSIVSLAPIYSNVLNLSLTWVFKIVYPLIFSLVPLGLYKVFEKQTNGRIAFLACIFFISVNTFYVEMLALARQEIADLFLVLLILLMVDIEMHKQKKSFLLIVFSISLIVSHYGLAYIYMGSLLFAWLLSILAEKIEINQLVHNLCHKSTRLEVDKFTNNSEYNIKNKLFSSTYVMLFVVVALTWYIYMTTSSTFIVGVDLVDRIISNIKTDFLNPEVTEGLNLLTVKIQNTLLNQLNRFVLISNQILITVGVLSLLPAIGHKNFKFARIFIIFSAINLFILFAGVLVPFFGSSLNMTRIYHTSLYFLAPFCIIGGMSIFKMISRLTGIVCISKSTKIPFKILSVYLVIFMLLQTGFAYHIVNGTSSSISISQEKLKQSDDLSKKMSFYNSYTPEQDVYSAKWISHNRNKLFTIYSDSSMTSLKSNVLVSTGSIDYRNILVLTNSTYELLGNSYIYLRYVNIKEGIMGFRTTNIIIERFIYNTSEIYPMIEINGKIYSNGGSDVYLKS